MKFNWKANWEILLVLVIIVVGIVITTIAAIRNKEEHLLPLAEETDFGQLLAGGSAGLSDTTVSPQQTPADGQSPNTISGQATAAADEPGGDISTRRLPALQQQQQQQSKSWRPSTFQPVVGLQSQQGNNQRTNNDNKHQQQQEGRQSKYDDNLSNEFTRAFDQLLQHQQQLAASGASSQQQQDSYDAMSSTEPAQTNLQFDPNHGAHNSLRSRDQRHHAGHQDHQNNNKTSSSATSLTSAAELDGSGGDVGPSHSPYGERLGGESADLNDDIHTTRSALALANNSSNHFMANSNVFQIPSQLERQLSALMGPSMSLHEPYGQQQKQASSLNQLGRLIVQNTVHPKLEPPSAASGSMALDADDMMTSYTRVPTTTNNSIADTILLRDFNLALAAANQSSQNDDAALINSFSQQQQQSHSASTNPSRHRAYSSPMPISIFLNDLLKFARLQPDLSSSQAPASQQTQRSLLQQLKLIPGPLLASIRANSGGSSGEQVTLSSHDASESNQHYHRVSMLPAEIHSILARSLRTSGVLPAFPAPEDVPQVWISPTSGGNPAYHETHNMDADFVASNAAGFVRSVGVSNPNEHSSFGQQLQQSQQQQQQQQHKSFMRPATSSNNEPTASYQQQPPMNTDNQPQPHHHHHHHHDSQRQQQPHYQHYQHQPQPMNPYGRIELAPVDQQQQLLVQQQPPQLQMQHRQTAPIYPSPRATQPVSNSIGAQELNWALEQSGGGGAYGGSVQLGGHLASAPTSEPQPEGTRGVYKPTSSLMRQSKGSQQNHQHQQTDHSNYNYKKLTQSHSQTSLDSLGHLQQQFGLVPASSSISGAEQSTKSDHNSKNQQQQHSKQQTHKYAQEQSRTGEVLVPLGYNPAPLSTQMSQQVAQPTIVLQQQQLNSDLKSLTRRRRSMVATNVRDEGGRVDGVMSGKYGDRSESDDDEDGDDARPISVVRPDGRPTGSGRVHGNQETANDRQTAQSQRSANHLHVKQPPQPMSMPMYDQQDEADESRAAPNGNRLSNDLQDLGAVSSFSAQQGSSRRRRPGLGRKVSSSPDPAESGLMSRLLGTASTTDEFEDDPEEADDDLASEKRKEDLEDAEFGLANPEERRNGDGLGSRDRAANSRSNLSRPKLRQPGSGSGTTASGEVGSYSRRHQQRADIEFYGHPGEETRQLKYGILGSGNYEVVNGGVYPDADESTAAVNSVANYVRKPGLLGKLFAANHHQAEAVGPQAALIAAGGRINGGFMRVASGSIGADGPGDLAGYVPAAELAKDLSGPLLELIDINGSGQLLDQSLLAQLGSSGSLAQTTHTSKEEESANSGPIYGKQRKLIPTKLADSQQQHFVEISKRKNKSKIAADQNEINTDHSGRGDSSRDDERPMKFSSSNRMPTNSEYASAAVEGSGDGNHSGNQPLQQQQTSISGSRLSHGTNQFNSYKILPSKKVTIFSDQDLDSAPSELAAPVR